MAFLELYVRRTVNMQLLEKERAKGGNKSPQNDKFKEKNKEKQKIVRKEKEKAKNIWSIPLYLLLLHVI